MGKGDQVPGKPAKAVRGACKRRREQRTRPAQENACTNCGEACAIGKGAFVCSAYNRVPVVIVLDEYQPTGEFFKCGGKRWKPQ